ncbi:MAG TPA: pilus assembly protein PilM, partial [Clostridiales bacterium]|nr:pilus assembly protein PilM [Clostridiales bacterium]
MIKRKRIAIDIGTHTIKLVIGSQRKQELMIHHAYTYPTPFESYHDGYIQNMESLQQAVQHLLWENDIRIRKVMFTMQTSSAMIREIVLPYTKHEKELQAMLSFEIEQQLPINLESHVMEYKILEEFIDNGIKKIKILIAVLPKKIVEEYIRLTKFLDLKPVMLNIHSDAISNFFAKER